MAETIVEITIKQKHLYCGALSKMILVGLCSCVQTNVLTGLKFLSETFHQSNNVGFLKTALGCGPKNYYKEKSTGHYWCYDYFYKDNREHYEVFDTQGDHICEADKEGRPIIDSKDKTKNIKDLLH